IARDTIYQTQRICYLPKQSRNSRKLHSFPTRRSSDLNKEIENFATKEEVLELKHKLEMKELENKSYLEKIEILEKRVEEDKERIDRKSTRLNSSHVSISYAVFCLKKQTHTEDRHQHPC